MTFGVGVRTPAIADADADDGDLEAEVIVGITVVEFTVVGDELFDDVDTSGECGIGFDLASSSANSKKGLRCAYGLCCLNESPWILTRSGLGVGNPSLGKSDT